ncbi:MAG: sensor domain-containing protein, partial [Solirubrobacteraceae bacterium]
MLDRVLAPLRNPRTGRELAFLLSGLPLGVAWLTALSTVWSLTLGFLVTPLVVPALIGVGLLVRGCSAVEGALARELLGVAASPAPRPPPAGWLRRAWATLADPWMWRAQGYLVLRMTFGWAIATGLIALVTSAAFLVFAPLFFWSIPEGIEVGLYHVHTLPQALPLVPVGLALLLVSAWTTHLLSLPWRSLAPVLIGEDGRVQAQQRTAAQREPPPRPAPTMQAVRIHALTAGGLSLFLIAIWALTSRGYFWPVWPLLTFAAPLAFHAWVTVAVGNRELWRERRVNTPFAIHVGVWVVLILFLVGVWAAAGAGYFWPVWPLLVGLLAVGSQLAVLLLGERERLTSRISTLETTRAGAVDVQEAELRRIERDLHDGAQARLVALGMSIGMAEQKLDTDAPAARALLADARTGAGEALRELRDLARGIHPPVLADR